MKNNQVLFIVLVLFLALNSTEIAAEEATEGDSFAERTIAIIDPFTKEIVKKISPSDYELVADFSRFKNDVEKWVHQFANGTENSGGYLKPMILDKIGDHGEIIKGRPLIKVDEEGLVEQIIQHSFSGGEIELPLKYIQSDYSEKDIPYLNEVVLASYSTNFKAYKTGRSKNIELSALAIDNVIVGNNDIFSFNSVVGPRDVATGYQMAPEIIKGKMVMGIGGGICQTSSTLFNAVDKLDLNIIERHNHSKDVGYVPKGRDATVSFGGLDFKFQNTLGVPFLVKAYYQPGTITIQIKTSKEYEQILKNELSQLPEDT
ncbi:VanW family protein [Ureibacillus sinduriensis]|uniref:VanW family protein n=1 Tax=Ureibacillus sinduriensis BLB-1 = JCM 15800 TaxID=1384057 RepID=A0A0A3HX46_9BACL|nr:VanW family protein [Ureibacillus sinduriensis]KGR74938.1 VanW family protein [Ureibacillus sinduriensis BLB-1 = JCM 15800]